MISAPSNSIKPRQFADDGDSSAPFVVGLVVAVMVHLVAFTGLATASKYNLFSFFDRNSDPASLETPDPAHPDQPPKPKSAANLPQRQPEKQTPDDERRNLLQTLLPPKKPDITFGKDGSQSSSMAWISYDDYQEMIAPRGKTEQPALQSQVDPLTGAPIRPDPTAPRPQSVVALNPQNRAIESGQRPVSGEMKPHRVAPPAAAPTPPAPAPEPTPALPLKPAPPTPPTPNRPPSPAAAQTPAPALLAKPTPEPDSTPTPPTPTPLPETPKAHETASSPQHGPSREIDIGRQQQSLPVPTDSVEGPGGIGASSDRIAMGPIPDIHQGQNSALPEPIKSPTKSPTAPKPNVPPSPPEHATPTPLEPTTTPAQAQAAKPQPMMIKPSAQAAPVTPATPSTGGNPAPVAIAPNPGPTDSNAGAEPSQSKPTGAPKSDREAAPVSLTTSPLALRPGRVIAGKGIEIKTAFPQFSAIALSTSIPVNPEIKVVFDKDGTVTDAQIIKTSTYPNIDGPILASLYKWRASGAMLQEINGPISVTIRMILIDEQDDSK